MTPTPPSVLALTAAQQRTLLDATRAALRAALGAQPGGAPGGAEASADAAGNDPVLHQPAGCFVSLHEQDTHRLRGCVGRLDANAPLLQSVRESAAGVLGDPRFITDPVTLEELPALELEVSVLSPLRPARDALDFDPLNDGIYLIAGERSGCFLPQVARETGWTREQLLDRLCTEKLGLSAGTWRHPPARLSVFSTVILGPVAF